MDLLTYLEGQISDILKLANALGLLFDDAQGVRNPVRESLFFWYELAVHLQTQFDFAKNAPSAELATYSDVDFFY